jgi:hypothetical protein
MERVMEKVLIIMKMEKSNMKENMLMIKKKEMEKKFIKVGIIM